MASKVEKICISLPAECMNMLDCIEKLSFDGFNMKRSQLISYCIKTVYWKLNNEADKVFFEKHGITKT